MSAPDPNPMSSASAKLDNRPDMAMSAPPMSDDAPTNAQKPAAAMDRSSPRSGQRHEAGGEMAQGGRLRLDHAQASQVRRSSGDGCHDLDDVVDVALGIGPAGDGEADEVHRGG